MDDLGPGSETVGETEFAQGVAAQAASGKWGKTRVASGIISGEAGLSKGGSHTKSISFSPKSISFSTNAPHFCSNLGWAHVP